MKLERSKLSILTQLKGTKRENKIPKRQPLWLIEVQNSFLVVLTMVHRLICGPLESYLPSFILESTCSSMRDRFKVLCKFSPWEGPGLKKIGLMPKIFQTIWSFNHYHQRTFPKNSQWCPKRQSTSSTPSFNWTQPSDRPPPSPSRTPTSALRHSLVPMHPCQYQLWYPNEWVYIIIKK